MRSRGILRCFVDKWREAYSRHFCVLDIGKDQLRRNWRAEYDITAPHHWGDGATVRFAGRRWVVFDHLALAAWRLRPANGAVRLLHDMHRLGLAYYGITRWFFGLGFYEARQPDSAFSWWRAIETFTVNEVAMRRRRLGIRDEPAANVQIYRASDIETGDAGR